MNYAPPSSWVKAVNQKLVNSLAIPRSLLVGCICWQICAETPFWTWMKVTVNRIMPYGISKGEESREHCQMEKSWLQSSELGKVSFFLPRGDDIELHLLYWNAKKYRCSQSSSVSHSVHYENMRLHTSVHTTEAITNFGWTLLLHPPYGPELTPSDYHLFGPFKSAVSVPLLQWWDPIDCCAPEAAQGGEHLLAGGNSLSCSKVEEGNVKERFSHSCQTGAEVR